MKLDDFDYELPEELIAQYPCEKRDESKLMILNRKRQDIGHHKFNQIIDFLNKNDLLVINETKVLPARLLGNKETGAKVELFLLNQHEGDIWKVLVKPGKRINVGHKLIFGDGDFIAEVTGRGNKGVRFVKFNYKGDFYEIIEKIANVPLPPYIRRDATAQDKTSYQTVYAKKSGAVAAPTAGLHFTEALLEKIKEKGIAIAPLILHVGLGTFRPVSVEDPVQHKMHSEYYELREDTADLINRTKDGGGRIVAVGTTSVRVLETVADSNGKVHPQKGWTEIFIYPPYKFNCVDCLITNFHLPKSTLLMLVSALAGREFILKAYNEAIQHQYRLFSYGDSMLIC